MMATPAKRSLSRALSAPVFDHNTGTQPFTFGQLGAAFRPGGAQLNGYFPSIPEENSRVLVPGTPATGRNPGLDEMGETPG